MRVVNRFRKEAVDLQPYGNTISVEAPSDNPFEDTRDVEVHTQVSGGMAGPDSAQRSKKIHTTAAQVMPLKNGQVPAVRLNAMANTGFTASFMPGMGLINEMPPEGGGGGAPTPAPAPDFTYNVPTSGATIYGPPSPTAAPSGGLFSDIFKGIFGGAKSIADIKMAQTQADIEKAKAQQAQAEAKKAGFLPSVIPNMGKHQSIAIPLVAVGVIATGAAIFLFMGKKKKR